jgi:hypothetical protein
MEEHRVRPQDYRRVALEYRGLPVVTALVLVGSFIVCFSFTKNYLLSSLVAAVPSLFLMRRWILAGRQIDFYPKCANPFPKKVYWTYPPKVCPYCGERLHQ